jgi:hypothetical protein
MSGNRIKYLDHKFRKNHLISTKFFVSKINGAKYRVVLNLEDMEYYIRNERTKEHIYKSRNYTNINVLKRTARARLEKLGVVLKREVRNRTFGVCAKGYSQKDHEKEKES